MRIAEMNWSQVEHQVARDRRAVLPIGSTEQHGLLSLCVDTILSERVAVEAAQPLRVPVFPVISYGFTPSFVDYAGTVIFTAHGVSTMNTLPMRCEPASIRAGIYIPRSCPCAMPRCTRSSPKGSKPPRRACATSSP